MNESSVVIRLEGNGRAYRAGETLSGDYWLENVQAGEIKVIELSVLWYTEGKGDEDFGVHEFRRVTIDDRGGSGGRYTGRFSVVLPRSPLSYEGQIVKLRWCVRVRAFLTHGREVLGQVRFRLGCVPAAKAIQT